MKFEEKFIAFVDTLGFKNLVEASESGIGLTLPELMDCLAKLGSRSDESRFVQYGPIICPRSRYQQHDLSFKVTQISDCVIVSSEASPSGAINLVNHCWSASIRLLMKGIMCRGYITRGLIYHQDGQVIGTGYQRAYASESGVSAFKLEADERGTPFIEIDPEVCRYIETETDACVQEMFSRMVRSEDGTTALFPFQRLSHDFIIGGSSSRQFDPEREKDANNNMRHLLSSLKDRVLRHVDPKNEKAVRKARHYLLALDKQLVICDKTETAINKLCF